MSLLRPLPRGSWWGLALGLLFFFCAIYAAALTSSPWPLVAFVIAMVVFEKRGLRCPQCSRRLVERKVFVDGGPKYRQFWECSRCEAVWDGERLVDPEELT